LERLKKDAILNPSRKVVLCKIFWRIYSYE